MRKLVLALPAVALAVVLAAPTQAIVYGRPDRGEHPYVGALIAEWREPGVKEALCSGTLIDEDVFLTAAHCTAHLESLGIPRNRVWVSFEQDVDPITRNTKLFRGRWVTNPRFNQSQSDPGDLAVVLLRRELERRPARLPRIGKFDRMFDRGELTGKRFTAVGYGVKEAQIGGGPPTFPFDGERWQATSEFRALTDAWLKLSQNPSTGEGGTCYGDSGGPNFLGGGRNETRTIASVTVTGDAMCRATNVTYRLDTRAAHRFIDRFLD